MDAQAHDIARHKTSPLLGPVTSNTCPLLGLVTSNTSPLVASDGHAYQRYAYQHNVILLNKRLDKWSL